MRKVFFITLILVISCSKKGNKTKNLEIGISQSWTEFITKDSIPKLLKLTLAEINKGDFEIANHDEKFEATDVITNDSLPNKQLRILARKNNIWRLTYVQGGFAKHYVYVECKIQNDSIYDFKIAETTLKLESNEYLDKLIKERKLRTKELKIITEIY